MEATHATPAPRPVARPIALFLASAALAASGAAALAWSGLPYEAMARYTSHARFQAWEGVLWMFGLVLAAFGLACVLQVVGWRLHEGAAELGKRLRRQEPGDALRFAASVLPWWLLACGAFLIGIAMVARAALAP